MTHDYFLKVLGRIRRPWFCGSVQSVWFLMHLVTESPYSQECLFDLHLL